MYLLWLIFQPVFPLAPAWLLRVWDWHVPVSVSAGWGRESQAVSIAGNTGPSHNTASCSNWTKFMLWCFNQSWPNLRPAVVLFLLLMVSGVLYRSGRRAGRYGEPERLLLLTISPAFLIAPSIHTFNFCKSNIRFGNYSLSSWQSINKPKAQTLPDANASKGKIHQFSKIAATLKQIIYIFSDLKCPKPSV